MLNKKEGEEKEVTVLEEKEGKIKCLNRSKDSIYSRFHYALQKIPLACKARILWE